MFCKVAKDRFLNFAVWAATTTTVAGHVLPQFGMTPEYGAFFLAGVLANVGMFESYARIIELVHEMADDRPILYYATLPIRSSLLVIRIMVSNALRFMMLGLCVLPIGKIVLGHRLALSGIAWPKLILMYVITNCFYGACSVWLATFVQSILSISNIWTRIVFPIGFLGGLQFSQAALARALRISTMQIQ